MNWISTIGTCFFIFSMTIYSRIYMEVDANQRQEYLQRYRSRFSPILLIGSTLFSIGAVVDSGWFGIFFFPGTLLLFYIFKVFLIKIFEIHS